MSVQDDSREKELVQLFQLQQPKDRGRSDTDAYLEVDNKLIPFELKSSTKSSVTTVRDFGPDHVKKWKDKHWLFGFYNPTGSRLLTCRYGSPSQMEGWIEEKKKYVLPDFVFAQKLPECVDYDLMLEVLGHEKLKDTYTLEDAKRIQKKQYSSEFYKTFMDLENGYSKEKMLEIIRDRCKYILKRGATLNNPHIPASFLQKLPRIALGTSKGHNPQTRLIELVKAYLSSS